MPFLDHLEELRSRILRILLAVVAGFGLGLLLVNQLNLIEVLKGPIAPFLPDGKLTVLSPTEPVMIVLKLGFISGLVLASPVILWQLWAFLSPALYEKEKKAIVPSLFAGLILFLIGAVLSFLLVVPKALSVLLSIEAGSFATMITYDKYFGFVIRIMLGMGLSFELPLIIITLAALGVVTPVILHRFRRYWLVLAFVGGAFFSPGPDVFSMMIMTLPLLLLYEVGVAGAMVIHRRRRAAASLGALLLLMGIPSGSAMAQQDTTRVVSDSMTARDSIRAAQVARDSAAAQRMGLPTAPSKSFGPGDSILQRLLARPGFAVTRYMADSASLDARSRLLRLQGQAMTERSGAILEAESIEYDDPACRFTATGGPRLFQNNQVAIGDTVRYDTCVERGVLSDALTSFNQEGANWFIRGNLAVDSVSSRLYAAAKEITSCDLPESHYHFAAKEVKWVSQSTMVARPAVLYIRDVPVLWLPFIFQDTKQGRRSGILVPQFGFNDIVRPTRNFNRQVTDMGYYWAASDYFDFVGKFDWLANRSTRIEVAGQYRWLDRFLEGNLSWSRQTQIDGSGASNTSISWNHRQSFGVATRLTLNLDLVSNTQVRNDNAIDPIINTQNIRSSMNLDRRFRWGTASLGGTRVQNPNDDEVQTTFPRLTINPNPIDLGGSVTWSPTFNLTNATTRRDGLVTLTTPLGELDSLTFRATTRNTTARLTTPLRIGTFDWRNTVDFADQENRRPSTVALKVPDLSTPEPDDSITVQRVTTGTFSTTLNWDTGINLPLLFRSSWKVTPSIGIANKLASAPFIVRNERTGGAYLVQGKRLSFSLGSTPTFFGFFPGFGPIERIRHSISPSLSFRHSPKATVSQEFAEAVANPGQVVNRESPAITTVTLSLSQNFEAKEHPAPGDTTGRTQRKFRLLGISTSGITFDFEQAKKEGRNGWVTQSITNRFDSDLLPGFDLTLGHDLWRGVAGFDSSRFEPFLQSVSASFTLTGRTVRGFGSLFGLADRDAPDDNRRTVPPGLSPNAGAPFQAPITSARNVGRFPSGRGFSSAINVTINRNRPPLKGDTLSVRQPTRSFIRFNTTFSPTAFWAVAWDTNYNATEGKFESHIFRLQRDLHDWQAAFNFAQNANGNFSFFFSIHLIDLPDIKFDYNQTSVR